MQTAREFYGSAFTAPRAELLEKAFTQLQKGMDASTEAMADKWLAVAAKNEAEAFAA